VRFTFSDEQRAFQRAVRDYLEKECPPQHVRAMAGDESGRSPALWKGLADLGVVGLTVPESYGGLGMNEIDLVLILEEAGRAALPEPLVETTAIAASLIRDYAPEQFQKDWLPKIASGEAIITVSPGAGGPVTDAHAAMLMLVPGERGIYAVPTSELVLAPEASVDATRRVFSFEGSSQGELIAPNPEASEAAFDRGAFATAAVLCGIADRVIELAAAYAKERQQFGKPIGSFQAVKHLLADALLGLEFARPAVWRSAWSIATDAPDRARDTSIAKALASDAAVDACRAALQVHGAIGYTHEHDLHLWLNKGFALSAAWGSAARHRDRVGRIVLDPS